MSGSPRRDTINPRGPTFLRQRADRTADSESELVVPFPIATGGGTKSKWVGHLEARLFGRPYAAIFLANTSSLVECVDSPSASIAISNRRESFVLWSPTVVCY